MHRVMLTTALMAWGLTSAMGAEADRQAADEVAIRRAVESYVAMFNRGDAKALAAMWSPEAVYVLTEDTAAVLVHFADGQTQQWLMVRLEEPAATQ